MTFAVTSVGPLHAIPRRAGSRRNRCCSATSSCLPLVTTAIQEKLQAEQQAQRSRFVLDRERQEAERKRVEAQGIADFQGIVDRGISSELLKWKAIEVAHELSKSPNAKLILGDKTGLPIIINDK